MAFIFPELVIESVLREGFDSLQATPTLIDDVFGTFTEPYLVSKYGVPELNRIKNEILNDVSFVHSFPTAETKTPCVSIHLLSDDEDVRLASLDDYHGIVEEAITDPITLAGLIIVNNFTPTSYDATTGTVYVSDSVNLSTIHANHVFEDVNQDEFIITGGIINTLGAKQFQIDAGSTPNIVGFCDIKSGINFTRNEIRGLVSNVKVLLGVHTKEPLFTKFLYTLVKYFILSRKKDLLNRCFFGTTFQGSDFTRDMDYQADLLYTRFLTISGKVEDNWLADSIQITDNVESVVLIDRDVADAATLGIEDFTIQPDDNA